MRRHRGLHPCVGALDVCPLVWIAEEDRGTAEGAGDVRCRVDRRAATFPSSSTASSRPSAERSERAYFRRGRPAAPGRADGGRRAACPTSARQAPHPTAGATLVTARPPLVAFNVELDTADAGDRAADRRRAARVRRRACRACGRSAWRWRRAGAQVSTNVHDPAAVPLRRVVERVRELAAHHGARPVEAELVGLAPEAALDGYPGRRADPRLRPGAAPDRARLALSHRCVGWTAGIRRLSRRMAQTKKKRRRASTAAPRADGSTRSPPAARPQSREEAKARARPSGRDARPRASTTRRPGAGRDPRPRRRRALRRPAAGWLFGRPAGEALAFGAFMLAFYIPVGYFMDTLRLPAAGASAERIRRRERAERWTSACSPSGRWPRTASSSAATAPSAALIVDPGDEATADPGRGRGAGREASRRSCSPTRHFDHIGAVAPVADGDRRAGLLPRDRGARARRHHVLRPLAGLRPVRELRRRRDRRRRRDARARGSRDRRDLHPRPQPRPRHLLDPATRRRSSPATSSSRARSAAPTCPAATGPTLLESHPHPGRRPSRPRPPSIPGTWGSPRSAPSGRRTRSWPSSRVSARRRVRSRRDGRQVPGPARDLRRPPGAVSRCAQRLHDTAAAILERAGYGRIETPVFEDTELFARGVGESTDIVQKEMFTLRGPGRAQPDPAPRGDGADLPRLHRARHAQAGAAGEALVLGPVLPPRAPAGGPLPPVPPDRRRGDRLGLAARRRRADRCSLDDLLRELGVPGRHACALGSLGSAEAARRLPRGAAAPTCARTRPSSPTDVRERIDANPLRAFDADDEGTRAVMAEAPTLLDRLEGEDAEHFAEVRGAPRPRRRRLRARPDPGPRPRLLHAHGLRVRVRAARRPVGGRRRRPLRRPRRAARRAADAGGRLGARGSSGSLLALGEAGAARPRGTSSSPRRRLRERALALVAELRRAGVSADLDLAGRALQGPDEAGRPLGAPHDGDPRAGRHGAAARHGVAASSDEVDARRSWLGEELADERRDSRLSRAERRTATPGAARC